ncbi:NAD-dependent epimerase/dehydratase family protein [Cuneatibacter caecimuris]|uniref:Nucleoside-diphosphate-sugar epimerase n=1 Tax=Cuneatibacter caecimuris TaxID=1796618 RepID=A0A4V2F7Q1_9FIRM|nr:NAD-dependent epimerase/dehydratase family protein [Cuneatibacter caecimuris]RZT00600.1 nucleoside-diphosphate-sugar epimerase [Cuneatibacter caecimuris]
MRILLIGGTGTISAAITRRLLEAGEELYLLNRGRRNDRVPEGAHEIFADINEDEEQAAAALEGMTFDVVADFIAFRQEQAERDVRLFSGRTGQYIFISSASAYQKPLSDYRVTEGTPLSNPYWQYSRDKIACEEYLMKQYRETGFPVTIVRPSHTYSEYSVPLGVHSPGGGYPVLKRMLEGKPVIIHGDGTSLWTMTHNTDFACGFTGLLGNAHAIGEAVQITSDESMTWNQIYQTVAAALGVKLNPLYIPSVMLAESGRYDLYGGLLGDKANTVVFDNSKLKRLVPGFRAVKRMDQGLRESVEYVMSHPELQKEDPDFDAWCDRWAAAMESAREMMKE